MQYVVLVGDKEVHVELVHADNSCAEVRIDGRAVSASVVAAGPSELGITLGAEQFWAQIDGDTVWLGERRLRAEVLDLRTLALRRAAAAGVRVEGPQPVRSPMPGRVVAVLAAEGQQVAAGEPLMVVEAMKMENELRAPRAGTVQQLTAAVGETVELGATLCFVA
jgi:acetyl/propionyl-CoA carboxylase alpha subunit